MIERHSVPMADWNAGVDQDGKIYIEREGVRVGLDDRLTANIRRELAERALANTDRGIETYAVGFFMDLRTARASCHTLRDLPAVARRLARRVRRSWRRRSYWNGYLAEWHFIPEGVQHTRCGRGWTRRRALASLAAHLVLANLHHREEDR